MTLAATATHTTTVTGADEAGKEINKDQWNGTSAHSVSLSGTADVAQGGTGASTAAGAATNLGLGTGDSPQFTAVNIGHATDTTLARAAAGVPTFEARGIAIILGKGGAGYTCPNDTNENILATVTIPAGMMGANGAVRIWSKWLWTSSANAKTLRVRFNGAAGTQYLNIAPTTNVSVFDLRLIFNKAATNSQKSHNAAAGATAFAQSALDATTSAVDTTVAVDIVFTGQKSAGAVSASDALVLDWYLVELLADGA